MSMRRERQGPSSEGYSDEGKVFLLSSALNITGQHILNKVLVAWKQCVMERCLIFRAKVPQGLPPFMTIDLSLLGCHPPRFALLLTGVRYIIFDWGNTTVCAKSSKGTGYTTSLNLGLLKRHILNMN